MCCSTCSKITIFRKTQGWRQLLPLTHAPRVSFLNVPVYAGKTRACVSTCARGAGTHGDVVDGHTTTPHRTTANTKTTTHQHNTQHTTHNTQLTTHNTQQHRKTKKEDRKWEREREENEDRERETRRRKRRRQNKTRREKKQDKRRDKTRREKKKDKRRDRMKKKREDEREKERQDETEERRWQRKWKELEVNFCPKNVWGPSNPPDELAKNVSKKKKSPSDELFLQFLSKVQNLAVFHLFTWFEFDFSGPGNKIRTGSGLHSRPMNATTTIREESDDRIKWKSSNGASFMQLQAWHQPPRQRKKGNMIDQGLPHWKSDQQRQ